MGNPLRRTTPISELIQAATITGGRPQAFLHRAEGVTSADDRARAIAALTEAAA